MDSSWHKATENIMEQAIWEYDLEQFEKAVKEAKEKLRKGSWLSRLFPFKIIIVRNNK